MEHINNQTELSFNEVLNKFSNLVKYMSKNYRDTDYTDSQDFYQEGMIILYKCWCKYKHKNITEFKKIFNTSINRLFVQQTRKTSIPTVNIEYDTLINCDSLLMINDTFDSVFLKDKIKELKKSLEGDFIATAILNEILCPSKRTLWEVQVDIARKTMLHHQGFKVYIPTPEVKLIHIRRALMLCSNSFNKGLVTVRNNALIVFNN